MLVFIRLLPETVTQNDLRRFISQALKPSWLTLLAPQGRIKSTEIRKTTYGQPLSVEYHGIVDIEPAKAAMAVIHKLNRTALKGRDVEVRKYYHRSPLRDRRIALRGMTDAPAGERRHQDRRRSHMITERVHTAGPLQSGQATPPATQSEAYPSS